MFKEQAAPQRHLREKEFQADLVVVGGGLAGTCCAITAARAGLKVVLVQDRPVLGGNASSEVRLWTLGATSHMNNNNRWAREGGVVDEILVENMYRNRESNAMLFDMVLIDKVIAEPNIELLLNTAVFEVEKGGIDGTDPDTINAVRGFCSQNSTLYTLRAPLFCDASGDGIVGFLAGAAFRMGAESSEEFGEKFAPSMEYGELLGHSIYFYSKDVGHPVKYTPPTFALNDITKIPRFRSFNARDHGCRLWWIEYGGRLDTVHETETIKWALWKVVYGVWDHIKNSGEFPEAETLTLEWVGTIPGKRESRRFEGDYMLRQQDIVCQAMHDDVVAFGGWSIDLHPADGVFSEKPGCNQWHAKGTFGIPYRCLYSRNVNNLFLAGRCISASHVAFGATRVMATCAHAAQAVALAAAICRRQGLRPAQVREGRYLRELQTALLRTGQHIPGMALQDSDDLAQRAQITASSEFQLQCLAADGPLVPLQTAWAQMLPVQAGRVPKVTFTVDVAQPTTLRLELRASERAGNFTPDVILDLRKIELQPGTNQQVEAEFDVVFDAPCYAFYCLAENPAIAVRTSESRLTGVLSVRHSRTQTPEQDIGIETFEFWCPRRRPEGQNFAIQVEPPLRSFAALQVTNGVQRPTIAPNAWLAAQEDDRPTLTLQWPQPQQLSRLELFFDTDFDHPMESVLWGHPESAMPFCVKRYRVLDAQGELLRECDDNHQARNNITFDEPVTTDRLSIELLESHGDVPKALFEVRCYA